ncbi:MAG: 50S ribosomal protein L20 [Candidatus Kerfeldbacteria bacterium]|nr:50S ribosomal protein L20 [Candidatus Kerfeldbacteria bacterium]
MRVKRGVTHLRRRKRLLKLTKGYRWRRKTSIRLARQAAIRAGQHAYRHRRLKKRDFRGLWQIRINAAVRPFGLNYSQFIHKLKNAQVEVDRKILAQLAVEQPEVFRAIVQKIKS